MNDKSFTASRWWTLDHTERKRQAEGGRIQCSHNGWSRRLNICHILYGMYVYMTSTDHGEKHFTLTVCRVVTYSSRSEAVFVKRKCTGGTISGSAHCGTEFMPGNSSQMISLHKCVKCPLKSVHNRLVYIFQWMKASFLRTTPEENYKPHIYPSTWFKRRRRSQRNDWECFMLDELKHLPGFLFKY